jgi:hypothetical protein
VVNQQRAPRLPDATHMSLLLNKADAALVGDAISDVVESVRDRKR